MKKEDSVANSRTMNTDENTPIDSVVKQLKKRHFRTTVKKPILMSTFVVLPAILLFFIVFIVPVTDLKDLSSQQLIIVFLLGSLVYLFLFCALPLLVFHKNFKKFCSEALKIGGNDEVFKNILQIQQSGLAKNIYFNSQYIIYYYNQNKLSFESKAIIKTPSQLVKIQPRCHTVNNRALFMTMWSDYYYSLELTFNDNTSYILSTQDEKSTMALANALQQAYVCLSSKKYIKRARKNT